VARIGEKISAYRVLIGKSEGIRPRGRLRRRWQDEPDRQERMEGVKLIDLARNRHKRLSVVKTVMNLPVA
jgi:hypothetical protein